MDTNLSFGWRDFSNFALTEENAGDYQKTKVKQKKLESINEDGLNLRDLQTNLTMPEDIDILEAALDQNPLAIFYVWPFLDKGLDEGKFLDLLLEAARNDSSGTVFLEFHTAFDDNKEFLLKFLHAAAEANELLKRLATD